MIRIFDLQEIISSFKQNSNNDEHNLEDSIRSDSKIGFTYEQYKALLALLQ